MWNFYHVQFYYIAIKNMSSQYIIYIYCNHIINKYKILEQCEKTLL